MAVSLKTPDLDPRDYETYSEFYEALMAGYADRNKKIYARFKAGETRRQLATAYDLSYDRIGQIVRRGQERGWR